MTFDIAQCDFEGKHINVTCECSLMVPVHQAHGSFGRSWGWPPELYRFNRDLHLACNQTLGRIKDGCMISFFQRPPATSLSYKAVAPVSREPCLMAYEAVTCCKSPGGSDLNQTTSKQRHAVCTAPIGWSPLIFGSDAWTGAAHTSPSRLSPLPRLVHDKFDTPSHLVYEVRGSHSLSHLGP